MQKTEVETYAKQLPIKVQQYFHQLIETKSNVCYGFLKRDALSTFLPQGVSIDVYPIAELHRLAKEKGKELSNELAAKKNPFKAFKLGLSQVFAEAGLSIILGIDLSKLPVVERNQVGEAMFLAALYFNCEDL